MRPKHISKPKEVFATTPVFLPSGEPRPEILRARPRAYMGLDLGQARDHAAIVVLRRIELALPTRDRITFQLPTGNAHRRPVR